ncbi:Spy/CpxP family protein refolding chaperone [Leptospira sp. 96542]|nr:Spy/CpxP family protein refolding chaperone [Leptospira sp. 96542]
MPPRMTPLSTAMLAATLLLATSTVSTPALAAPPGPAADMQGEHKPEHRAGPMGGRQGEHWEKRLAELHASLKLTPAQAPAWDAFHAAVKPPMRGAAQASREEFKREDWARLKTPERLDRLQAWRQEREAAAAQREAATRSFYATLTPEQQKTFDARTVPPFLGEAPSGPGPR